MKKLLKSLIVFTFVLMGSSAFAQYGTCAYVQGTNGRPGFWNCPQSQMYNTQPVYNNYGGGVPVSVGGGLSNCAIIGGIAGGTLGSLAKHHTTQAVILSAIGGGVVGQMVCNNSQGQRVIVQQPPQVMQQPVMQQQGIPQQMPSVQPGGQGTFCNIDGLVTREANGAACEAKAKAKAETLVSGQNVDMKQQQNQPTCAQGKTWSKLNWPGHPQHDGFVCLPDGDPHRY